MRASNGGLAAALLALGGLAAGVARAQTPPSASPILPGYWESTETYSVLLSGGGHDRKCLTQAQVAAFIQAPQTKHYTCRYAQRSVGGGQARFSGGDCFSHSGRKVLSDVRVAGRYTPESFHLDFAFKLLVSAGVGLPGEASIDARRIAAECPVPTSADR